MTQWKRRAKRCFQTSGWAITQCCVGVLRGPHNPEKVRHEGHLEHNDFFHGRNMYSWEGDWVLGPNPVRLSNHGSCLHSLNAKKNDWNHIAVDLKLTVLQLFRGICSQYLAQDRSSVCTSATRNCAEWTNTISTLSLLHVLPRMNLLTSCWHQPQCEAKIWRSF